MADKPVREPGWEQALADRLRHMLAEIARRHGLEVVWSENIELELECTWPKQPGLDFELRFALSDDELTFGTDDWNADIFPLDDPEVWRQVGDAIDGLVTGETRIKLYRALGRPKPYWSVVQLRGGDRWKHVSTGAGCAVPPIIRRSIVRNGHATQSAPPRPAWGCLLTLVTLAMLWWLAF